MDQWFVEEWRAEREANRVFREDVTSRLTALETVRELEKEAQAKDEAHWVNRATVIVSVVAVIISIIALF